MVLIELELLNPKNDYVFKRIFGHSGSEAVTRQMLNSILKRRINKIKVFNQNKILLQLLFKQNHF